MFLYFLDLVHLPEYKEGLPLYRGRPSFFYSPFFSISS